MEDRCCDISPDGPFRRCNATTPPRRRTPAHQHMNRGTVEVAPTPRPGSLLIVTGNRALQRSIRDR